LRSACSGSRWWGSRELPPAPPADSGLLVAPLSLACELLALITD
jgi:hypothetical protein